MCVVFNVYADTIEANPFEVYFLVVPRIHAFCLLEHLSRVLYEYKYKHISNKCNTFLSCLSGVMNFNTYICTIIMDVVKYLLLPYFLS